MFAQSFLCYLAILSAVIISQQIKKYLFIRDALFMCRNTVFLIFVHIGTCLFELSFLDLDRLEQSLVLMKFVWALPFLEPKRLIPFSQEPSVGSYP